MHAGWVFSLGLFLTPLSLAGVWSEWYIEGKCPVTCGGGIEHWMRRCETTPEDNELCDNKMIDVKVERCNMQDCEACPVPLHVCKWSQWGGWNECSATCGEAHRIRARNKTGACYCAAQDKEIENCQNAPCPQWESWSPWSQACKADCSLVRRGNRERFRTCRRGTAGQECEHTNCATESECAKEFLSCQLTAEQYKYACDTPITGRTWQPVTATLQYAVNTMGSAFLMAVCVLEIALFVLMWVFPTQRWFHLPQELSLLASHLGLCFMVKASENDVFCDVIIGYINCTFLLYFCFLCLECLHVMAFVSHTIRKGTLLPLSVQCLMAFAVAGGLTTAYVILFLKHMKLEVEDRRLCWLFNGGCEKDDGKTCPYPSRLFFIVHATLFALSFVFLESGMNLRRRFQDPIPTTNMAQLRDAEFAYSGLYFQIILSYMSLISTLGAFYYQVATPTSPVIFVWSTAALASDVALGVCIFIYHSFGVAKVRNLILIFKYKVTRFFCGCCRGPIKPPNIVEEE